VTGTSDTDDVQALAGGDRDAFAALFRRHHTFVYNLAFRRTASWAAAEDVTGVVFLELWRQRDRVESLGGSLRPWLAGVAANEARHVWRSRSRLAGAVGRLALVHGSDVAAGREPDPADDLAARIDDERAMAALLDTLDALPEAHREVITLWAWEQLSYDEIAVALDVPVGRSALVSAGRGHACGGSTEVTPSSRRMSVRAALSREPAPRCWHPSASRPRGRWWRGRHKTMGEEWRQRIGALRSPSTPTLAAG
jgi:RNA polymerase sigma-70 factor (ECF subfamily)